MKRLLLQSLAIPAIQLLFDLAVRASFASRGGSRWDAGVFLTGLLACWALSFACVALVALAARAGRWPWMILAGLLAFFHTVLLTSNFFLFRFFGEYLFPGAVAFLTDPAYMADYIRTFGGPGPVAALLVVWGVFFLCLRPPAGGTSRPWISAAGCLLALGAGAYALNRVEKLSEYRMPPDMVAMESLSKHFLRVRDKVWPLRPTPRLPVEGRARAALSRPRTVLLIVHESMGTRSLPFVEGGVRDGGSADGMPRLSARLRRDSAAHVVFQRAYTNSLATQVSMASIFSGVSPEESHRRLHCTPMLWDLAKAAGYRTAYFSSQRLRWASLSDFLLGQPIDSLVAREQTSHPPVNDMGMDDFHVVETLEAWVGAHPGEPLFVVWNTNALHAPFQDRSEFVDLSGVPGARYEKALGLLDTALARVLGTLERSGRLEDALIVSTADHGEDPDPAHPYARIQSYYEEFLRVPLWIRLPRSLRGTPHERALRAHARTPVANVDLAPTLAHLWGVAPAPGAASFSPDCPVEGGRIPWSGRSLFARKSPGERVIVALSTGDTRRWDGEGFGLIRGPWRLILLPDSGRVLYDVGSDPGQEHDLLGVAPDSVLEPFRRRIAESPWLRRIHEHHVAREGGRR